MESRFLAAIDAAVEHALPTGWPRVSRQRLPACGSVQARHAFRLAEDSGPASYLAVVAVPPLPARLAAEERDLAALVDHVIGRGASLLLLYEHEDDPEGWVREHLEFPHPRFLCLACAPPGEGDEYTAELVHARRVPLSSAIRDLWSGALSYRGPTEGMQTVGLEIMKDQCWRCHAALDTVTGIVFPDREVADWSQPDWAYFRQLLDLARIPDSLIPALSAAIETWRAAGERRLTVIRWRHSKTVEYAYWAAECTACGAFRGDYPLMEERQQWLDGLESRRAGILSYRPLQLDVPRQALQELTWGWEVNPHACFLGWRRTGDPELARSLERLPAAIGASGPIDASCAIGASGAIGPIDASCAIGAIGTIGASGVSGASGTTGAARALGGGTAAAAANAEAMRPAEPAAGVVAGLGFPPAPPPPGPGAVPGPGPLQRLGEILTVWLGWMGARRRPSIPARPARSTPPPPAPAARPSAGR
jgi:hypothetical protein